MVIVIALHLVSQAHGMTKTDIGIINFQARGVYDNF